MMGKTWLLAAAAVAVWGAAWPLAGEDGCCGAKKAAPARTDPTADKEDEGKALEAAPDFTITDVNGNELKLSALKGKVVLLDFWATWCPPCVAEIPAFVELHNEYKDKGFVVVGIAMEKDSNVEKLRKWMAKKKMEYPVALDTEREVVELYKDVPGTNGLKGIPTTILIDAEGKVRKVWVGGQPKAKFEKAIKKLIAG